jgi:hypothetical protein
VQIVQKHITLGPCCVLDHATYFALKGEVAHHFAVHPQHVVMVGSGKLGFSIAPDKRYRPFSDSSDLDLAIVSPDLFDRVWKTVLTFNDGGTYWPDKQRFASYLLQGWIRPDKLPPSRVFDFAADWWEFFRALTARGSYGGVKITAGVYRDHHFFERYQSICIKQCRQGLQ